MPATASSKKVETPGEPLTSFEDVTNFNNFYEFTTNKEGVARLAKDFKAAPWTVAVGGMVSKPMTFGIEDLVKKFEQEERIYRMRCVEGWSMVIPWLGFSLAALLKEVEPLSGAKYVRFETLVDPLQMPGQRDKMYPWPYTEGLRLDEAMNDLTILSTGLYGKSLLPQNGAPLRLVVPWKYGFKSIKSIVKIDLVDKEPKSLWMTLSPDEYGFYANVNPEVSHPRWSQASERRIGETARRRPAVQRLCRTGGTALHRHGSAEELLMSVARTGSGAQAEASNNSRAKATRSAAPGADHSGHRASAHAGAAGVIGFGWVA